MLKEEFKVSEEVSIADVKAFVEYHTDKSVDEEMIKKDYPDMIKYVQRGLLTFSEGSLIPTIELREPLKTEAGDVFLSRIEFRTRIVASEQQKIAKGVDLKNDGVLFLHKCIAYMIKQPVAMLDKIGKFDNKAIEQIATLFI